MLISLLGALYQISLHQWLDTPGLDSVVLCRGHNLWVFEQGRSPATSSLRIPHPRIQLFHKY